MKKSSVFSVSTYVLAGMVFAFSCNRDLNNPPSESFFNGIAQTDTLGTIIQDDAEDWQPRTVQSEDLPSSFSVSPAYPNPAGRPFKFLGDSARAGCALTYVLPERAFVTIQINTTPEKVVRILAENTPHVAGQYLYFWDLKDDQDIDLPNNIYRVFIQAVIDDTTYKSYGDVKIQR